MSKFKLIKKSKPVMEDEVQPQQGQDNNQTNATQSAQNPQLQQAQADLVKVQTAIDQLEAKHLEEMKKYTDEMKKLTDQKMLLNQKIQSASSNESADTHTTKAPVNESVAYGKQAELSGLIQDAFANVEDKLSYWPSIKEIEDGFFDHIARGVIRYINKNGFGMADETDHTTDIANALLSYFKNTKVNYSDREIEHIYLALLDVIEKTENSFKWLVKKKQQKQQ